MSVPVKFRPTSPLAAAILSAPNDGALLATLNPEMAAQGIVAETPPPIATAGVLTDGTIYFVALSLFAGQTVNDITIGINTAGVGVTLSKVGLYAAGPVRSNRYRLVRPWVRWSVRWRGATTRNPSRPDRPAVLGRHRRRRAEILLGRAHMTARTSPPGGRANPAPDLGNIGR